jgi:HK97 family phage prohead protease
MSHTRTKRNQSRTRVAYLTRAQLTLRAEDMPDGICGRVQGIALVYGVTDAYNTRFVEGCLDRTKREKLAAGKVQLYMDHTYGVRCHIGVVRSLETVGDTEVMTADLFDTEDGRRAKEYLTAVTSAKAQTGLSIGFYDRAGDWMDDGEDRIYEYTEVELEEISLTPRPAVPGANVTGVRNEDTNELKWVAFDSLVSTLPIEEVRARVGAAEASNAEDLTDSNAPSGDSDANGDVDSRATMDDRILVVRKSYAR